MSSVFQELIKHNMIFRKTRISVGVVSFGIKSTRKPRKKAKKDTCKETLTRNLETIATSSVYSLLNGKTGQRDLLASMTMVQDYPGKSMRCRHVVFFIYLLRSMERSGGRHNRHSCQLQRKKSVTKMEKP